MAAGNGDLRWLRSHISVLAVDAALSTTARSTTQAASELAPYAEQGYDCAVVYPTQLAAVPKGMRCAAAIGYPWGRSESLVKAAEARLAIHEGAEEAWVYADATLDDNALLSDLVAVRQAIPRPIVMVVVPAGGSGTGRVSTIAELAGADAVLGTSIPIVGSVEEAIEALAAGATRLASWGSN